MLKKILVLIVLSLYVGNSYCAAAADKQTKEQRQYTNRMSAFAITESTHLVVKILNILLDELRARRDIEMHHKENILEEYRQMVLKKAKALDESKADFKKFLNAISSMLTSECLSHNRIICMGRKIIAWEEDSEFGQLIMMIYSIASQKYNALGCTVSHKDLVWKVLTADELRAL